MAPQGPAYEQNLIRAYKNAYTAIHKYRARMDAALAKDGLSVDEMERLNREHWPAWQAISSYATRKFDGDFEQAQQWLNEL